VTKDFVFELQFVYPQNSGLHTIFAVDVRVRPLVFATASIRLKHILLLADLNDTNAFTRRRSLRQRPCDCVLVQCGRCHSANKLLVELTDPKLVVVA
jgi:hypothetical protein